MATKWSSAQPLFVLVLVSCLIQLSLAAEGSTQSIFLAFALSSGQPKLPETALGKVTYTSYEDGSTSAALAEWYTPEAVPSKELRVGLISPEYGPDFIGSTVLVSKDVLLDKRALIQLHVDTRTGSVWSISVSKQGPAKSGSEGPAVAIIPDSRAPKPAVNKPVVVSAEGKVQEPPQEKSLLQRYWWVLLGVTFLLVSSGGGSDK